MPRTLRFSSRDERPTPDGRRLAVVHIKMIPEENLCGHYFSGRSHTTVSGHRLLLNDAVVSWLPTKWSNAATEISAPTCTLPVRSTRCWSS